MNIYMRGSTSRACSACMVGVVTEARSCTLRIAGKPVGTALSALKHGVFRNRAAPDCQGECAEVCHASCVVTILAKMLSHAECTCHTHLNPCSTLARAWHGLQVLRQLRPSLRVWGLPYWQVREPKGWSSQNTCALCGRFLC